ncbi:3-hydroxyacyl-CoA dehydrogenase family protein [Paenibacillus thalictri]|uniref:L-gulonate 3-dehydrogenase n=1 Tax=Paenibacillus thalictri TaxID=2527873 RepID=A0A4Q9DQG0_9BACL|nr:3-hydroxyacyl-CoA dehydrogenase NAD-binding domain-containing protein [Paenibacillus thalictri]TBL76643.1 3-hydroxyacyl-CoA dehydrogenase family protein [Paenibacillus thalictri]
METLTVLGAGLMGHSIALTAAWSGLEVTLQGVDEADLERAGKGIRQKLDMLQENGLVGEEEAGNVLLRIHTAIGVEEAVQGASFVIEAIPEQLELKIEFFRMLDRLCGPDVILASNTSGLSPTAIASQMQHPQRMVVTHFWNPAHLIPLVEVVRGEHTGDQAVGRALEFLRMMKKRPIEVKKDILGSVGNRIQYAILREAQYILEQGVASMEDIDAAVTYSLGRRLPVTGPFMTADMGGLDVFHSISSYLFPDLSKADVSFAQMRELVEHGRLGAKSGSGFYAWDERTLAEMNRLRERELIHFLKRDREEHRE